MYGDIYRSAVGSVVCRIGCDDNAQFLRVTVLADIELGWQPGTFHWISASSGYWVKVA